MNQRIDLHCHLLPYVDDGAEDLDTAMELLRLEARQGVKLAVATPHWRPGMFETSAPEIARQYARLKALAARTPGLPHLFLGQEYYWTEALWQAMQHRPLQTLADSGCLLVEFSHRTTLRELADALRRTAHCGYFPVIAHAERYPCLRAHPEALGTLRSQAVWVQLNAGSILGQEGWEQQRVSWGWLRRGWVDCIASDTHDPLMRRPNLGQADALIRQKLGNEQAELLLFRNPAAMLRGEGPLIHK